MYSDFTVKEGGTYRSSSRFYDEILVFLKWEDYQMRLSQEDGQLYYKLWLDFVNQNYLINEEMRNMSTAKDHNPVDVKEVADKLWSDVGIIDLYLEEHLGLPENDREIIQGWKRRIHYGISS